MTKWTKKGTRTFFELRSQNLLSLDFAAIWAEEAAAAKLGSIICQASNIAQNSAAHLARYLQGSPERPGGLKGLLIGGGGRWKVNLNWLGIQLDSFYFFFTFCSSLLNFNCIVLCFYAVHFTTPRGCSPIST